MHSINIHIRFPFLIQKPNDIQGESSLFDYFLIIPNRMIHLQSASRSRYKKIHKKSKKNEKIEKREEKNYEIARRQDINWQMKHNYLIICIIATTHRCCLAV